MLTRRGIFQTGFLIAALAAVIAWQRIRIHALEVDEANRSRYFERVEQLKAENLRLRRQLLKTSASMGVGAEPHPIGPAGDSARATPNRRFFSATALTRPAQWSNRGTAAPRAAFETTLYALNSGDVDAWISTMHFTDDARAKAADFFAQLPSSQQQEFQSPESLIGNIAIGHNAARILGADILSETEEGPDTVVLRAETQMSDGRIRVVDKVYQNIAGSWQTTLGPEMVDMFIDLGINQPGGPAAPQSPPNRFGAK